MPSRSPRSPRLPRWSRPLLGAALVVALAAAPRAASAQTPSEIATARQWFSDGLAREEKNDFVAALELFRRAAQVKRTPQIVYHVGFCESRSGALVEALVDLETAVSMGRASHADDVVKAAQAELAEVRQRIPSLEIRVPEGARPTRVVVDGNAVALSMLTTAMPLDPGAHTVTIDFPSGSATQKVTLVERGAQKIELAPPASEAAKPPQRADAAEPATEPGRKEPAPPPPAAPPVEAAHRSGSALPWIAIGVGGVLVGGGAVLFVVARGKEATLDEKCPRHTGCDPSLEGDYDTAKTLNAVGIGLGAVGLAAAAVGVSMLVLNPTPSTSASLALTPGGASLRGRF